MHGIFGELISHCLVEEFGDRHILAESLPTACLHEEFSREVLWWTWLEGVQHDAPIHRVARYDGPMIKHGINHGLPLRKCANIRLESKAINHREECLDTVQR